MEIEEAADVLGVGVFLPRVTSSCRFDGFRVVTAFKILRLVDETPER